MPTDEAIRTAAFGRLRDLVSIHGNELPWPAIAEGFRLEGQMIHFSSRPRGIFSPRPMARGALSVKTSFPRLGRTRRYEDIASDEGFFAYKFQGSDPGNHDNQRLKESWEDQSPLIYFHGVSPATYQALFPAYISAWLPDELTAHVVLDPSPTIIHPDAVSPDVRKYRIVEAKARLHQSVFRQKVLRAYGERCALSGLPETRLLEAAHIIPDRDKRGIPTVPNGIAMASIFHQAYDANLIGIDADGGTRVSKRVLGAKDGPLLKALQGLDRQRLRLPADRRDHPNRDYLSRRFAEFLAANG